MVTTDEMNEVSVDYFAGLFDSRCTIKLNPMKNKLSSIGYRIDPGLSIPTYNDIHTGLVAEFLEAHDIEHVVNNTVEIGSRSSIEDLYALLDGKILGKAEQLSFVVESVFPAIDDGTAHSIRGFLKLVKGFEDITPRWEEYANRKYTAEFFLEEFANRFEINPWDVEAAVPPDVEYPSSPSIEYFAGFIDNAGRFVLPVKESNEYDVGYSFSPSLRIIERWVGPRQSAFLEEFFNGHGIDYTKQGDFHHINSKVNGCDNVNAILELIGSHLYIQYPQAEFLYQTGIPAIRDGYHLTKQGFYELLAAFESLPTTRKSSNRKYTAVYFEELWDREIDQR